MNYRVRRGLPGGLALVAVFLSASSAWAVDRTWTGTTSTVWSLNTNWSGNTLPGVADRAIIPAVPAGGRMPVVGASTSIQQLQVFGTLTINTGFTLTVLGSVSPASPQKPTRTPCSSPSPPARSRNPETGVGRNRQ